MSTDAVSGITGGTTAATSAGGGLRGTRDEFLRLFMAQLQHQDPLDPTSGADMVAQLAQLGTVEQTAQINEQLAALTASQASSASADLANLVGRDCAVQLGDVTMAPSGAPPPVHVTSDTATSGATLVITDADGREVRRIPIPPGRDATVSWDGLDADGRRVPAGAYNVSVDPGASRGTITASWTGTVDAVELTPDGPRLRMGGVLVAPGDVRTIGQLAGGAPQGVSQ